MDPSLILSADYLSLLFWINLYTHTNTHLYVEDVCVCVCGGGGGGTFYKKMTTSVTQVNHNSLC